MKSPSIRIEVDPAHCSPDKRVKASRESIFSVMLPVRSGGQNPNVHSITFQFRNPQIPFTLEVIVELKMSLGGITIKKKKEKKLSSASQKA